MVLMRNAVENHGEIEVKAWAGGSLDPTPFRVGQGIAIQSGQGAKVGAGYSYNDLRYARYAEGLGRSTGGRRAGSRRQEQEAGAGGRSRSRQNHLSFVIFGMAFGLGSQSYPFALSKAEDQSPKPFFRNDK
jgi:hypothetical protein